jgi:EAL domain-containing protein (putative c-di-GMP-specific phosphodiesterase class I)/ActR/RegA family two-component response regulator
MNRVPKILIVDDLKTNRLVLMNALKDEGYDFIEASNGKEAMIKALLHHPIIILMDGVMPIMDGFEAIRLLRKHEELKRTPILMISSLEEVEKKVKAINSGASDFINKPFNKEELISRCRSYASMSLLNEKYILSTKHPTTGLSNKRALINDIEGIENSIFVIKLNHFHKIISLFGQHNSEFIEQKFLLYLQMSMNRFSISGNFYHTNDGEYVIVLKDGFLDMYGDVKFLCEALSEEIQNTDINLGIYDYSVDATICYAHGSENLYDDCELAIFHAIEQKTNYVVMNEAVEDIKKHTQDNLIKTSMLKSAIENNRIVTYYQPIFDNKTKEINKYEALVRLIDDEGKVLSPFFFLELAKEVKLYSKITNIVLERVFSKFKNSDKEVSINISYTDIVDETTYNNIFQLLSSCTDTASRITFELLEDESIDDDIIVENFINEVKKYGAKIAIDDFGAGFSNFKRIMDYKPNYLKIDGSIIKKIATSKEYYDLSKYIYDFAKSLKIECVAEFVCDEDVYKLVQKLGIDYSQGYYISQPVDELIQKCEVCLNKKELQIQLS